jgi:dephospho-CoA kinase
MTLLPTIIGLSGTNGSGKDTIGEILAKDFNFLFISVTELLRDELKRRNLEIERVNMRALSSEWRKEHGLGVLVKRAYEEYLPVKDKYSGLVMSSLRNPGEVDEIHELGGILVWSDANPKLRYERIQKNSHLRNRAGEDNKTYEQFLAEEEAEMNVTGKGDETSLSMHAVKEMSDLTIVNEFDSLEELSECIRRTLKL